MRADNQAALQTYLEQGFQIIGTARRHAKIDGRYVDEILIEKWLEDPSTRESGSGSLRAGPAGAGEATDSDAKAAPEGGAPS